MINADIEDKLEWLTTQRQDLVEKHRGQWVVIDPEHNKVFASDDLECAVKAFQEEHPGEGPHCSFIPDIGGDEFLCPSIIDVEEI